MLWVSDKITYWFYSTISHTKSIFKCINCRFHLMRCPTSNLKYYCPSASISFVFLQSIKLFDHTINIVTYSLIFLRYVMPACLTPFLSQFCRGAPSFVGCVWSIHISSGCFVWTAPSSDTRPHYWPAICMASIHWHHITWNVAHEILDKGSDLQDKWQLQNMQFHYRYQTTVW